MKIRLKDGKSEGDDDGDEDSDGVNTDADDESISGVEALEPWKQLMEVYLRMVSCLLLNFCAIGFPKKKIKQLLEANIIRPSRSPWASPITVVSKKDGGMRMCGDYRRLNEATVRDSYPLSRIDDLLDTLEGVQWISTLDAYSGYFQIELREEDKPKTAIISKFGLYEYNRLPFGLCNTPATFQRAMNNVLELKMSKLLGNTKVNQQLWKEDS
jgi:hypothetical protein